MNREGAKEKKEEDRQMFSGKNYTLKSEKTLSSLPSRSLRLRG